RERPRLPLPDLRLSLVQILPAVVLDLPHVPRETVVRVPPPREKEQMEILVGNIFRLRLHRPLHDVPQIPLLRPLPGRLNKTNPPSRGRHLARQNLLTPKRIAKRNLPPLRNHQNLERVSPRIHPRLDLALTVSLSAPHLETKNVIVALQNLVNLAQNRRQMLESKENLVPKLLRRIRLRQVDDRRLDPAVKQHAVQNN